ncbi:MAG: response regulator [Dongiaceae bacterium]
MAKPATKKVPRRVRRPEDLDRVDILAVEGMLAMLGTLSGILRSFRFNSVNVFANSEEAWARLTGEPRVKADVILMDWNAHPLNGETFVRQLRRAGLPLLAETPVITVIANADRPTVFAARDCGVNAVLLRPYSAAQLLEKVMWTLGQDTPFIRSEAYVGPDRRRFRTEEYLGEKRRIGETDGRDGGPDSADNPAA